MIASGTLIAFLFSKLKSIRYNDINEFFIDCYFN